MKKQKLKNLLKIGILTFGFFFLINCEKNNIPEEVSEEILPKEIIENLPISIKTTSFLNADIKFKSLTNKYNIDSNKNLQPFTNTQSKTTTTNKSSIVVYTDIIKEITQGDYTSYTMLIESLDDDPNTFYNLTMEEENGNTGMFVTQYRIVHNKTAKNVTGKESSSSNMEISTRRIDGIQKPIGPEDFGNEGGGSSGSGSGGGGSSTTYPTDCDGLVITTTVATSIPCGCGHSWEQLLNNTCTGCQTGYPTWPSLETNTVYECVPSSGGGHNSGGGTNTGRGSPPPNNNGNGSITTPVNPDGTSAVPDILTSFLSLSPAQTDLLIKMPDLANDIFEFLQQNNSLEAKTYAKGQIELETLLDKGKIKLQPLRGKINNRDDQKYTHYGTDGVYAFYKMEDGSTVISSPSQLTLNSDGQLVAQFTSEVSNSHYWYIKLEDSNEWANYLLKSSTSLADELRVTALLSAEALGKAIGKYVLPVEDIKVLLNGTDFEGQKVSRYQAGGFLLLSIIPGSKALKIVGNAADALTVVVKLGSNNLVVDTAKAGVKVVTDRNVIKFLNKTGNEIARVVDGIMTFKYSGFGGNIITNPNKTTTLIGKWDNLKHIWETGLAKHGSNKGGLNILGEPFGRNVAEIWTNNKTWLDRAISRGDIIRATANPLDINNVFYNTSRVDINAFSNISNLKTYLLNLSPDLVDDLGYYGREIRHLFQNGYNFNSVTNTFVK